MVVVLVYSVKFAVILHSDHSLRFALPPAHLPHCEVLSNKMFRKQDICTLFFECTVTKHSHPWRATCCCPQPICKLSFFAVDYLANCKFYWIVALISQSHQFVSLPVQSICFVFSYLSCNVDSSLKSCHCKKHVFAACLWLHSQCCTKKLFFSFPSHWAAIFSWIRFVLFTFW